MQHTFGARLVIIIGFLMSDIAVSSTLPVPAELKADVRFWENIFGKYSSDQCVVHDSHNLNIVYDVVPVRSRSSRGRLAKTRKAVDKVQRALRSMGKSGRARTAFQRKVVRAIPRDKQAPWFYRKAARQVRCQRGVDLKASLKRSKVHLPMIRSVFRRKDLPMDLAYLPHLESGFNSKARSKAGAVGLWQFMQATARGLGLKVTRSRDYRYNPYLSTVYAAKYLKRLHRRLKTWPLAITAYNYGENGVGRAVRKYGYDYIAVRTKHKTSLFRFAARNYYPSFIAAKNVAKGTTWSANASKSKGLLFGSN